MTVELLPNLHIVSYHTEQPASRSKAKAPSQTSSLFDRFGTTCARAIANHSNDGVRAHVLLKRDGTYLCQVYEEDPSSKGKDRVAYLGSYITLLIARIGYFIYKAWLNLPRHDIEIVAWNRPQAQQEARDHHTTTGVKGSAHRVRVEDGAHQRLQEENEQLKAKISQNQIRINELTEQLESFRTHGASTTGVTTDTAELEPEKEGELRAQITNLQEQNESLQAKVEELSRALEQLRVSEARQIATGMVNTIVGTTRYKIEVEGLKSRLAAQVETTKLRAQQVEELRGTPRKLVRAFIDAHNSPAEREAALQAEELSSEQELIAARAKISSLDLKLRALTAQSEAAKVSFLSINTASIERFAQGEHKLQEAQQIKARSEEEVARIQRQLNEAQAQLQELTQLKVQYKEAQEALQAEEARFAELEEISNESIAAAEQLKSDKNLADQALAQKKKELEEVKQMHTAAKRRQEELQGQLEQLTKAPDQLEELRRELETSRRTAQKSNQAKLIAEDALSTLRKQYAEQEQEVERLTEQVRRQKSALETAEQERERLEANVTALPLPSALDEAKEAKETAMLRVQDLEGQLKRQVEVAEQYRNDGMRLVEERGTQQTALESEKRELQNELARVRKELEEASERAGEAEAEFSISQARVQRLEEELKAEKKKVAELSQRPKTSTLNELRTANKEKLEEAQRELERTQQAVEEKRREASELQNKFDLLTEQYANHAVRFKTLMENPLEIVSGHLELLRAEDTSIDLTPTSPSAPEMSDADEFVAEEPNSILLRASTLMESLQKSVVILSQKLSEVQAVATLASAKAEQLEKQVKELADLNRDLQTENTELKGRLATLEGEGGELVGLRAEVKRIQAAGEEALQQLQQRLETAHREEIEAIQRTAQEVLQQQRQELEKAHAERVQGLERQLEEKLVQIAATAKARDEFENCFQRSQAAVGALEEAVRNGELAISHHKRVSTDLQAKLFDAKSKAQKFEDSLLRRASEMTDVSWNNARIKRELENTRKAMTRLKADLAESELDAERGRALMRTIRGQAEERASSLDRTSARTGELIKTTNRREVIDNLHAYATLIEKFLEDPANIEAVNATTPVKDRKLQSDLARLEAARLSAIKVSRNWLPPTPTRDDSRQLRYPATERRRARPSVGTSDAADALLGMGNTRGDKKPPGTAPPRRQVRFQEGLGGISKRLPLTPGSQSRFGGTSDALATPVSTGTSVRSGTINSSDWGTPRGRDDHEVDEHQDGKTEEDPLTALAAAIAVDSVEHEDGKTEEDEAVTTTEGGGTHTPTYKNMAQKPPTTPVSIPRFPLSGSKVTMRKPRGRTIVRGGSQAGRGGRGGRGGHLTHARTDRSRSNSSHQSTGSISGKEGGRRHTHQKPKVDSTS